MEEELLGGGEAVGGGGGGGGEGGEAVDPDERSCWLVGGSPRWFCHSSFT